MSAREWLDGQVDTLVSFQVVISVEALGALIAFERSVVLWIRLSLGVAIHLLHMRSMSAVEPLHHRRWHAANERNLAVGVADIGHDWARQGILEWALVGIRRLRRLWLEWRDRARSIGRRHPRDLSTSAHRALLYRRRS